MFHSYFNLVPTAAVLLLLAAGGIAQPAESGGKCPLTLVMEYEFSCAASGSIKDPSPLLHPAEYHVNTTEKCASKCFARSACQSFFFNQESPSCILFSKPIDEMKFHRKEPRPGDGLFYNRNCFSTNCKIINSCNASLDCKHVSYEDSDYYEFGYRQFACSYGRTARMPHYQRTTKFNGSLETCDAIKQCAHASYFGSWDLHWIKELARWECKQYDDFRSGYYDDYGALELQGIDYQTYSVRNKSIGAGYGFLMTERYPFGPDDYYYYGSY